MCSTRASSAFFDVAFRFDEPAGSAYLNAQQKRAIAAGDLTGFHADLDLAALRAGDTDALVDQREGIASSGYRTRIFASHFEPAQGRRLPSDPGGPPPGSGTQQGGLQTGSGEGSEGRFSLQFGWPCRDDCVPDLPGRLQRFSTYVPEGPAPDGGYGALVWTNGYALTPGDAVAGDRDLYQQFAAAGILVIGVDARGNDNWFYGAAGAAVFEALADARRHWPLDPDRTHMGGFSSGAYGANKLSLSFPDVFAGAFICDGLDLAPSFPGLNGIGDMLPVDTLTRHEDGSKLTPCCPAVATSR